MVRRRSLLPALVVVAATVTALPLLAGSAHAALAGPPAPTSAGSVMSAVSGTSLTSAVPGMSGMSGMSGGRSVAFASDAAPLSVTIDSLNPSVIPTTGPVTISGTVTNTSEDTWSGVNVYPLTSSAVSMTTVKELDAAARADDDLVVGERIVEVSDQIPILSPGQVAPYVLRVPRRFLATSEGVHWLGVHTLGQNDEGRDEIADGKARTFLPLVEGNKSVEASLILQLRRRIDYTADGRIDRPDRWASDLSLTGRLQNLVDLGASAGSGSVTWLLDPAVVETVGALVAGNGSRMVAPAADGEEPPGDPGGEAGGTDPTALPAPTNAPLGSAATDPTAVAAAAAAGQVWLDRLQTALAGKQILTLPYGDVDASAASRLDPTLLTTAHTMSATAMAALGLTGTPAIGSPSGFLNPAALAQPDPATTVLVTNSAVGIDAPTLMEIGGQQVVLTSATAIQGGPGPDDPFATIAMRQRILSEAAVRLLSAGREPLVVALPTDWVPEDLTDFFPGLEVDWLDLVPLSTITGSPDRVPEQLAQDDYDYPAFQETYELDSTNFVAADALRTAGDTISKVLLENPSIGKAVTRESATVTSYWQRATSTGAAAAAQRSTASIRSNLGRVTVDGPPSVTLSSATGAFPATIRNGLDEPVLVRVEAVASSGLTVQVPQAFELDAGESTRLRLSATTRRVGAHTVELVVAAADGTPLGATAELPVRSNQVSQIIWIVIVAGGGLLFGAIAVRLFRRVRRARAEVRTAR